MSETKDKIIKSTENRCKATHTYSGYPIRCQKEEHGHGTHFWLISWESSDSLVSVTSDAPENICGSAIKIRHNGRWVIFRCELRGDHTNAHRRSIEWYS
jgi:hypothetical protein